MSYICLTNTLSLPVEVMVAPPAVTGSLTDQRAQCEHVLFLSIKHRLPPAPSSLTSALLLVLSPAICPDFASTSVRMSKMASPIDVDGLWRCSGVGIGSITVWVKAMPPSLLTPSSLRVTSPDLTQSSVRPQGSQKQKSGLFHFPFSSCTILTHQLAHQLSARAFYLTSVWKTIVFNSSLLLSCRLLCSISLFSSFFPPVTFLNKTLLSVLPTLNCSSSAGLYLSCFSLHTNKIMYHSE